MQALEPSGLFLFRDFISPQEEQELICHLDGQPWAGMGIAPNPEMKRRTQMYGYVFSYHHRRIEKRLGDLPEFLRPVQLRLQRTLAGVEPTQRMDDLNLVVVNEYQAGQGIMPHIDADLFGPYIGVVSLLSSCVLRFVAAKEHQRSDKEYHIFLEPRSLLIMSGESRYQYKHGIDKTRADLVHGDSIERSRRVSLTFRSVPQREDV